MSPATGKSDKIWRIVRIRQMLRRWRAKESLRSKRIDEGRVPSDVPAGHVAVSLVPSCNRFVLRATHLNHPIFRSLLTQAGEEYGFANSGPLAIPCDDSLFQEILRVVSARDSGHHLANLEECRLISMLESRPLLRGLPEKSIC